MKPFTPSKNPGSVRDNLSQPQPADVKPDLLAEPEAINLQEQVQQLRDEQHMLNADPSLIQETRPESADVEQQYKDALEVATAEKEVQAENLENRLESLIEKQEAVLQQMLGRQPGFLALPGQKAKWQSQVQQQQSVISRLHNRLDTVKEIHDGMGLHGSRINELATAKVRHDKPELAEGWDEMRAAQRAHENLLRRQAKEQKEKLQREQAASVGKSNSHSLSLTRSIT